MAIKEQQCWLFGRPVEHHIHTRRRHRFCSQCRSCHSGGDSGGCSSRAVWSRIVDQSRVDGDIHNRMRLRVPIPVGLLPRDWRFRCCHLRHNAPQPQGTWGRRAIGGPVSFVACFHFQLRGSERHIPFMCARDCTASGFAVVTFVWLG